MQAYLLPCGVAQCWQMWKGLERVGWCWLCGWGSFSARCCGSGRTNRSRSCYRLRALGSSVADARPPPSPQVAVHSRAARIHPHSQSWVGTQCVQEQRAVESKHSLLHMVYGLHSTSLLCRSSLAEIVLLYLICQKLMPYQAPVLEKSLASLRYPEQVVL